MKLLLLVNSSASSVTARTRVIVQSKLAEEHQVTVAETSRRGHAARLARGAANNGTDCVVVLGGDGTLNETANGLVGTDCAIAALPGGSTNVFARSLGLPHGPVEAVDAVLESLGRNAIRRVGLGSANDRFFVFHCGIGYDAAVVHEVERHNSMKRWAGHPLFAYAAVKTWVNGYDRDDHAVTIHADATEITAPTGPAFFAIVLNTSPYTYLGTRPFNVAPDASLDRPLAVVGFADMPVTKFIMAAASALGSGAALRKHPNVAYRADVHEAEFTAVGESPFPYQLDGDPVAEVRSLTVRWVPDCINVLDPSHGL